MRRKKILLEGIEAKIAKSTYLLQVKKRNTVTQDHNLKKKIENEHRIAAAALIKQSTRLKQTKEAIIPEIPSRKTKAAARIFKSTPAPKDAVVDDEYGTLGVVRSKIKHRIGRTVATASWMTKYGERSKIYKYGQCGGKYRVHELIHKEFPLK